VACRIYPTTGQLSTCVGTASQSTHNLRNRPRAFIDISDIYPRR
jgi:hypothetical protein